jgi:ABC-2 type transport system permease protein
VSSATYVRYELVRTFRNRRFLVLSLGIPLILYLTIAAPNRNEHDLGGSGIDAPLYFMVGLIAFGTMNAVLAGGARIALERQVGWNRQLRLTPLSASTYFRTKVLTGYVMAAVTIALLYAAGISLDVSLSASAWVRMTVFILLGLVPFAALGILLGHVLTPDSIGPALGGTTALTLHPRRRVVPGHERRDAPCRRGAPVLLARPGEPHRTRGRHLGSARVDRRRSVDSGRRGALDPGLPPRYGPRLVKLPLVPADLGAMTGRRVATGIAFVAYAGLGVGLVAYMIGLHDPGSDLSVLDPLFDGLIVLVYAVGLRKLLRYRLIGDVRGMLAVPLIVLIAAPVAVVALLLLIGGP